jgi:formiminoglutamase
MSEGYKHKEVSENRSWQSMRSLLGENADTDIALLGIPMAKQSITPGRCDLAPKAVRAVLPRLSTYDLQTGRDLSNIKVFDAGDLQVSELSYSDACKPVAEAVRNLVSNHRLAILLGGDNAITRPGVRGVDASLREVGLLTLDAHFDLRDTDGGLNNGNPVQALLEDGLPGSHISQVGLAPYANTKKAHMKAIAAGNSVRTLSECTSKGLAAVVREELSCLSGHCSQIYVDFDIDVIDRSQMPSAPGARPGGIPASDFFEAARIIAANPLVRCVDLVEFDPSKDLNDIGTLTAGRWLAEILAGFEMRCST